MIIAPQQLCTKPLCFRKAPEVILVARHHPSTLALFSEGKRISHYGIAQHDLFEDDGTYHLLYDLIAEGVHAGG